MMCEAPSHRRAACRAVGGRRRRRSAARLRLDAGRLALGIPFGVSDEFLVALGDAKYAGLGLGLFGGGAAHARSRAASVVLVLAAAHRRRLRPSRSPSCPRFVAMAARLNRLAVIISVARSTAPRRTVDWARGLPSFGCRGASFSASPPRLTGCGAKPACPLESSVHRAGFRRRSAALDERGSTRVRCRRQAARWRP